MNPIIILFFLLCLAPWTKAQSVHKFLKRGDKAFAKEQYEKAVHDYQGANAIDAANTKATYNTGVAEYRLKNKNAAYEHFEDVALTSTDKFEKTSALYNKGTMHLFDSQLDESIQSLKEALRLSPDDKDIRKNLAKAMQLKRQQQEQQNQDQQNQDQQNQDQQNQDQQNQDQQNQDQQNQDQQNQDQQNQDQQNQDQQNQDRQNQSSQTPIDVEKQQALNKLKQVEEQERRVRQKLQLKKGKNRNNQDKDW